MIRVESSPRGAFITRVLAFGSATPPLDYPVATPEDPWDFTYFSLAKNGDVLFHGRTRTGLLGEPVVFLPHEVRFGMRWEAKLGSRALTFEVVGREPEVETPYGVTTVWTVTFRDNAMGPAAVLMIDPEHGASYDPSHQPPPEYVTRFAEGFGPLAPSAMYGGEDIARAVLPIDDEAPELDAPALTLAPLNDGAPLFEGMLVTYLTGIDNPARSDVGLRFTAYGVSLLPVGGHIGVTSCADFMQGTFVDPGDCHERGEGIAIGPSGGEAAIWVTELGTPRDCVSCNDLDGEAASACLNNCGDAGIFFGDDGTPYTVHEGALGNVSLNGPLARLGFEFGAFFFGYQSGERITVTTSGARVGLVHARVVGESLTVDPTRAWTD